MKNINLLTILLCFGLSLIAKAESSRIVEHLPHIEETTRKHFILEAGYIGALSTAETEMADTKHGVSGGFLFDVFGERYFNFEIGVFVTQQGFAYGSKEITTVGATDVSALNELKVSGKSTYVGIPLLAKLNLAGRVSNTAFILAGISSQFLVANEVNIQGQDKDSKKTQYVLSDTNAYDPPSYEVTGIIGLGGAFKVSNLQSLLVQAIYNRGFIPIHYSGQGIYNQSFLLTLGFGVDLWTSDR